MIASLADAWRWCESVKTLTRSMERLGRKYWDSLPWEGDLGQDTRLRGLMSSEILGMSRAVLDDLDDLCVLLLFSVFESVVRDRVREDVAREAPEFRHPALIDALDGLHEAIEHGSFFRVLKAYKGLDANLVEEVNQVRRYRNWVAHGRRGAQPEIVDPRTAFERLQRFLELPWGTSLDAAI